MPVDKMRKIKYAILPYQDQLFNLIKPQIKKPSKKIKISINIKPFNPDNKFPNNGKNPLNKKCK